MGYFTPWICLGIISGPRGHMPQAGRAEKTRGTKKAAPEGGLALQLNQRRIIAHSEDTPRTAAGPSGTVSVMAAMGDSFQSSA